MAINKKLIHFLNLADFETRLANDEILDTSIVFIKDAKKIWTHGNYYDGSTVDLTDIENSILNILDNKQDTLISGTNIKTVNGENILGEGNITTFPEAPTDDKSYVRKNAEWVEVIPDVEITYAELKTLYDNANLVPGTHYAITDYSCVYIQPLSNIEMEVEAHDVKYIICTAVAKDKLDEHVQYIRHEGYPKIVECKYDIDSANVTWTSNMTQYTPKGAVWYMCDEFNNRAYYDFKHVKFRRWAILDIQPNLTDHDGSTTNISPYKVCANDNSPALNDGRFLIGSGENNDRALIQGIFDGKFLTSTPEWSTFSGGLEASDEYALHMKPYLNTEHPRDKYLAWVPDMNGSLGFLSEANGPATVQHAAIVTTDENDYIDCYTIDFNGEEGTDVDRGNYIRNVEIENRAPKKELVNLVLLKSSTINIALITNVKFRKNSTGCTFLLRSIPGVANYAMITQSEMFIQRSLCMITLWQYNNIEQLTLGLINGSLQRAHIRIAERFAMFGYYINLYFDNINKSLFYGIDYKAKLTDGTYLSKDGCYTYALLLANNNYGNIYGPMQYCYTSPHFNSNTFRAPYTKGVKWDSNNQLVSYGYTRWGVHFGYSACNGHKLNSVEYCDIPTSSFIFVGRTLNNEQFDLCFQNGGYETEEYEIPDLRSVDVTSIRGYSKGLYDLSNNDLTFLSRTYHGDNNYTNNPRKKLSAIPNGTNNTTWVVYKDTTIQAIDTSETVEDVATRNIKDAKDLSTNELIYFKSHAEATYMSDGTTVENTISNIDTALAEKQATLVSGTNIKTVNGTSLLGSGDVEINAENTIPVVNYGTSDTTFTLTPNVFHIWEEVSSLTLTLETPSDESICNEYMFQFTSGSTATTLSLPTTVLWTSNLNIEANKTYQVSILNNYAIIAAWGSSSSSGDSSDTCCFIAGTQILMADNTTKPIEDMVIGDKVISLNTETNGLYETTVKQLITHPNTVNMATVTLENGNSVTMHDYHPLYTTDGWKSLTNYKDFATLEVGDSVITNDGNSIITNIERWTLEEPIVTYNLNVVDDGEDPDVDTNDNYFANGICAHNAGCPSEPI